MKFNYYSLLNHFANYLISELIVILSVLTYLIFALKTQSYAVWQYVFLAFDRMGTMSLGAQCMNNFAKWTYIVKLFSIVYGGQFAEINQKVARLIGDNSKKVRQMSLGRIIRQHTSSTRLLQYLNHQVISREIFLFLIMNFPFNIYLVTRIIHGQTPQSIVIAMTLVQLFCGSVANLSAISLNRQVYANGPLYVRLQQTVKRGSIGEQYRINLLFEELSCAKGQTKMMGITAGPLGLITAYSTFKVSQFETVHYF